MATRLHRSSTLTDLVRRYPELDPDERARVRSMLRKAGYLELMLLLIDKEAQAGLENVRAEDEHPAVWRAPAAGPPMAALLILLAILIAAALEALLK